MPEKSPAKGSDPEETRRARRINGFSKSFSEGFSKGLFLVWCTPEPIMSIYEIKSNASLSLKNSTPWSLAFHMRVGRLGDKNSPLTHVSQNIHLFIF